MIDWTPTHITLHHQETNGHPLNRLSQLQSAAISKMHDEQQNLFVNNQIISHHTNSELCPHDPTWSMRGQPLKCQ